MDYIIRKQQQSDCKEVAHIVTVVWNETYRGIVPEDFLLNLYKNEDERAINSYNNFNEKDNHQYVLEVNGEIVGFVNVGESDEIEYDKCGELYAIYILSKYKGNGYGKKLFEIAIKELKNMGYDKMVIGCLDKNSSNDFYKHMGGKFIKTRIFQKLNLPENVYLFENI